MIVHFSPNFSYHIQLEWHHSLNPQHEPFLQYPRGTKKNWQTSEKIN